MAPSIEFLVFDTLDSKQILSKELKLQFLGYCESDQ
jgi:hypothetical protein